MYNVGVVVYVADADMRFDSKLLAVRLFSLHL